MLKLCMLSVSIFARVRALVYFLVISNQLFVFYGFLVYIYKPVCLRMEIELSFNVSRPGRLKVTRNHRSHNTIGRGINVGRGDICFVSFMFVFLKELRLCMHLLYIQLVV